MDNRGSVDALEKSSWMVILFTRTESIYCVTDTKCLAITKTVFTLLPTKLKLYFGDEAYSS